MALVGKKTYMEWIKNDHWIRKNFNYAYSNPLWDRPVPKQYSLCSYFWKSVFISMILLRLIIVPSGRFLSFILGNTYSPIGGWLYRKWRPVLMKHDGGMFSHDKGDSPIIGFFFTIVSMAIIGILFLISTFISFIVCMADHSATTGSLGLAVLFYGFLIMTVVTVIYASLSGLYPEHNKKMLKTYMWLFNAYIVTVSLLNCVSIFKVLWFSVSNIVICLAEAAVNPFAIPLEVSAVLIYLIYRSGKKSSEEFERNFRMIRSDFIYIMSIHAACNHKYIINRVISDYGFRINRISEKMAFQMRCEIASSIISSYDYNGYNFDNITYTDMSDRFDVYVDTMRKIQEEIDSRSVYVSAGQQYFNDLSLSSMIVYAVNDDEFIDVIIPPILEKYDSLRDSLSETAEVVVIPPKMMDCVWERIVIPFRFVGTAWSYFVDVTKAKKQGFCPVLNLEPEGEE